MIEDSDQEVLAWCKGELIKKSHPVVGDYVTLSLENEKSPEIIEIKERASSISRRLVREKKTKTIAANIDALACVSALSRPKFKSGFIDRMLVRAIEWEIPAIIILNKWDEYKEQESRFKEEDNLDIEKEIKKYENLGAKVYITSASRPDLEGQQLRVLQKDLKGKTLIMLGQSGVGKSKLIQTLSDNQVSLKSDQLAKKVEKGGHTTTWVELIKLPNFSLLDSPGIRALSLIDHNPDELITYFPDLFDIAQNCRFSNCRHFEDSHGCGFQKLYQKMQSSPETLTQLELILIERLKSYHSIIEECESLDEWQRF